MTRIDYEDSRSSKPSSSVSRGRASHGRASKPKSSGGKVKEMDFTPKTRRLAIAGKSHVKLTSLYDDQGPFPATARLGRLEFAWETLKDASRASDNLKKAFQRASVDQTVKKQLTTFVSLLILLL